MGVYGLARLLRDQGCLPADSSCEKTLWRGHDFLSDSAHEITRIPPHSTLALDGNGLSYYLHHVAYSRHFSQGTGGNTKQSSDGCCCNTRNLSETQVTRLLPQNMPLTLLQEVTREFVQSLQRNHLKLVVYWDGEGRRMKAATTSKRKEIRDTEWSHLKQYSLYGVFPQTHSSTLCRKDWLYNFPMSRLLIPQVRHSLAQFDVVSMIDCDEEADLQVAKASADDPNCYCVGLDSDYCLFPNTRYIPLNTLDASGNIVTAVVLTRADIAEQLDFVSEGMLVEFSILMGNDYVDNSKGAQLDFFASRVEDILEHVRDQDEDYRVTSKLPQVQQGIEFTRALYDFQDFSEFPLDVDESILETEENENEHNREPQQQRVGDLNRPRIPDEMDLSLAVPKPLDFSISNVIARPIQALIDNNGEDEQSRIQQKHLNVYFKVVERLQQESPVRLTDNEIVRPVWENVMAAYIIERMIAHVIRENPSSSLVRISCPAQLFDHGLFHSLMNAKSKSEAAAESLPSTSDNRIEEEAKVVERTILPIDEHEAAILDAVDNQRVTIIHGETGCGKSSRVPVMLLRAPPPDPSMQRVKMFISQPLRIAAKSLVERMRSCEPDLRNSIALRMGHGVREYENSKTRAWFVTTGYLVRLLANHPESFDDCSHLIIDEVHERSIDTDILCLLCRRLLETNRRIRLILMSATMAATLYQTYFGVPEPPIHVGARRFPIKEYYIEDLTKRFTLPAADMKAAKAVINDCERTNCGAPPSNSYMENLFRLAARVVMCVGRPGSSILIFVPGMNEIISITDLIEKQYIPGIRFTCYPIHSDVPFEEQMIAFDSPAADEIKVVIATNAAESSVTLPDVDHVICLGLCKQIVYNASSHRQMLMPAWISRASATQRAGRTGRVRKGNVYRLYTKIAFEEGMDAFETGEMLRIPLDSVILTLKEMLGEKVTPVLLQCLEPPDVSTIHRSFKSLSDSNFITKPDDSGSITTLGKFVSSLGIDLALGSLIGLGIQFGLGAEIIEMAAILSFPKSPWIITNPLFHEPPEFNDITARTFMSRCHFDANLYSEPLAIMNLIWDFERVNSPNGFAKHYSLSAPRLRRLIATRKSLRNRVAEFVGVDADSLCLEKPPAQMDHSKVTLLRVLQVWVFSETMIESIQAASTVNGAVTLSLTGDAVTASHLEQVLDLERHPFYFVSNRKIVQNGSFSPVSGDNFSMTSFLIEFEARFVSFAVENSIDMFWYSTGEMFHLFVPKELIESEALETFCNTRLAQFSETDLTAEATEQRRGYKERPCGLWDIRPTEVEDNNEHNVNNAVLLTKFSCFKKKDSSSLAQYLSRHVFDLEGVASSICCTFTKYKKKKGRRMPNFLLISRGAECSEVSQTDLNDLFATPNVSARRQKSGSAQQKIVFSLAANTPIPYYKRETATGHHGSNSSWHRALLNDIPEGARLLSVLASARRNEHSIWFLSDEDVTSPRKKRFKDDNNYLEVSMNRDETKISKRWRQFSSDRSVYVAENTVPAAAMSTVGPVEVFACCANTLEVRGGGLRVEGLTLLPPGRLFALLALLTFGLHPFSSGQAFDDGSDDEYEGPSLLSQSLRWLNTWDDLVAGISDAPPRLAPDIDRTQRILAAKAFHKSCAALGESLVCHPEKVSDLCKIFDLIDGNSVTPWKGLSDNPFTEENLRRQRSKTDNGHSAAPVTATPEQKRPKTVEKKVAVKDLDASKERKPPKGSLRKTEVVDVFPEAVTSAANKLFATSLEPGDTVGESDLPSTNILSIIIKHYCDFLLEYSLDPEDAEETALESKVTLADRHWVIRSVKDNGSKEWFLAEFVGTIMPFRSVKNRGHGLPGWIFQGRSRPYSFQRAMECVPPNLARIPRYTTKISFSECDSGKAVFFDSIERALQMEAAFWLERQFGEASRRWYQQSLEEMMIKATTLEAVVPRDD